MKKVKWGILGAATIAVNKGIPAIERSENSMLYAIASRSREKLSPFKGKCEKLYDSYYALLEDPEVQAVYIPLPNHLHCEWTIKALQAGKHVLCEKPIAMNYDECCRMAEAAKSSGRYLMEAFMYRHTDKAKKIIEIVKSGVLGEIQYITSTFGFDINDPTNVRLCKRTGGGALFDLGCYSINLIDMIAEACGTKLESSHAYFVTRKDMYGDYVDVRCNATLNYDNGMTCSACSFFDAMPQDLTLVVGRKGSLWLPWMFNDSSIPMKLQFYDYEADPDCHNKEIMFMQVKYFYEHLEDYNQCDSYCREVSDLSRAILNNEPTTFPFEASLRNMKTITDLYSTMGINEKSPAKPRY